MDRLTPDRYLSDLERRVSNVIHMGVVADADYSLSRVRVRIGPILTDWLPWSTPRAGADRTFQPVEVGEQVVIAARNGDLRQGVIIGSVNSDARPAPGDRPTLTRTVYEDGTTIEYDRESHAYSLAVAEAGTFSTAIGGTTIEADKDRIKLTAGGVSLEISAAGVEITGGDVTHDGKPVGKTHRHTQVQAGGAVSGPPQ